MSYQSNTAFRLQLSNDMPLAHCRNIIDGQQNLPVVPVVPACVVEKVYNITFEILLLKCISQKDHRSSTTHFLCLIFTKRRVTKKFVHWVFGYGVAVAYCEPAWRLAELWCEIKAPSRLRCRNALHELAAWLTLQMNLCSNISLLNL